MKLKDEINNGMSLVTHSLCRPPVLPKVCPTVIELTLSPPANSLGSQAVNVLGEES